MRQCIIVIAFAAGAAGASAQPVIQNGGFEANTPTFGAVPNGWSIVSRTPDIIAPGGLQGAGPSVPASPAGGTFVGIQAELAGQGATPLAQGEAEAFEQTVTGLVPGVQYDVTFFQANIGYFFGSDARFDPGAIEVIFGTELRQSPLTLPFQGQGAQLWEPVSLRFTAALPDQILRFRAVDFPGVDATTLPASNFGGVGLGIDGVAISVVPSPASAGVLCLAGLAAARRRRST